MILAEVNTEKDNFHVVAEDESDARDKSNKYLKDRYFTESVIIKSITVLSSTKKFHSDKTLIL